MSDFIRIAYKSINKISPTIANIAAAWYSTINGWRFDDLKSFIKSELSSGVNSSLVAKMRSLECIESNLGRVGKVAFVSPMPPENTGIAYCTFYSFYGANEEIDIFCRPSSDDEFLSLASRLGSKTVRLLDVNLLAYADDLLSYKKIFISLGNSHHHYYLWDVFKKSEIFGFSDKCIIYAHDPYLNNFIQSGLGLSDRDYVEMISEAYSLSSDIAARLAILGAKWRLHAALHELGITGIRLLVRRGFSKFLVNSKSAKIIFEKDLGNQVAEIYEIFHPVFEPTGFSSSRSSLAAIETLRHNRGNSILVGTFGVPGNSKGTHIVIDSVRHLRDRGVDIRLVVAGFGVTDYFKTTYRSTDDFIIKIDSPSDAALYSLMNEVDIAVQLRLNDAGESSGVIPQLLMAKKKVIVSPVGSFKEYGGVVDFLSEANPVELSELIQDFLNRSANVSAMDIYCRERSPVRYRKFLLAHCE